MKKIGILTINNDNNYGNRLQNYAVQTVLENMGFKVETILNQNNYYNKNKVLFIKLYIKKILKRIAFPYKYKRYLSFLRFNKYINFSKKRISGNNSIDNLLNDYYDFFITGSDQVWNPTFKRFNNADLLCFAVDNKRISFSASFGINKMPEECYELFKNELSKFKAISVREEIGKKIVNEVIKNKNVDVLVDPTMLLTVKQWDKVAKKPVQLNKINCDKYILNYFLGELSNERKKEIDRFAKENECLIINILDKNSPFYNCGPSEFLYLEKNAFLICTDSFHSSVFAILYGKPFIVFDREDNKENMSSRIDTLLSKFKLENRKFTGEITIDLLQCDYSEAYKILEIERNKSENFLKNALGIND